jgi:hypothetical protein
LDVIERSTHIDIAMNPKTAMRGQLPGAAAAQVAAGPAEQTYASAEMRDYLSDGLAAVEACRAIETSAKRGAHDDGGEPCLENLEEVRDTRSVVA